MAAKCQLKDEDESTKSDARADRKKAPSADPFDYEDVVGADEEHTKSSSRDSRTKASKSATNRQNDFLYHNSNQAAPSSASRNNGSGTNSTTPRDGAERRNGDAGIDSTGNGSSSHRRRTAADTVDLSSNYDVTSTFEGDMQKKMDARKRMEATGTTNNRSNLHSSVPIPGKKLSSDSTSNQQYTGSMSNFKPYPIRKPLERPTTSASYSRTPMLPTVRRSSDVSPTPATTVPSPKKYILKTEPTPSSAGQNAQRQIAAASAARPRPTSSSPKPSPKKATTPFVMPEEKVVQANNAAQDEKDISDLTLPSKKSNKTDDAKEANTKTNSDGHSKDSAMVVDEEADVLNLLESPSIPTLTPSLSSPLASPPPQARSHNLFAAKNPKITATSNLPSRPPSKAPRASEPTNMHKSRPIPQRNPRVVIEEGDEPSLTSKSLSKDPAPKKTSVGDAIDSAMDILDVKETPKRQTRAQKKKDTVVLIELSDGEDDATETPKTKSRRLMDDIYDGDGAYEDDADKKSSAMATLSETTVNPDDNSFHLQFYQDDLCVGHVSADEPTPAQRANTPAGIQFDSSLALTISKQGISIWKVLSGGKDSKSGSKKPKTPSTNKKAPPKDESGTVEVMDVDDDTQEATSSSFKDKTAADSASGGAETTLPSSTKKHLLLSHISPARVSSMDVFVQPGLIFIRTTAGNSMVLKRDTLKSSPVTSSKASEQTGADPSTAITLNEKKRTRTQRSKGSVDVSTEDASSLDKLAPESKKASSSANTTLDVAEDGAESGPTVDRQTSDASLALSYEVGEDDVMVISEPTITNAELAKAPVDEGVFEEKESARLFVLSFDRQSLMSICSLFMQLSKSKQISPPPETTEAPTESKDSTAPASKRWFEIYGRSSSELTEIPSTVASGWWKPDVVAEADKKVLKSPTRLKPSTPLSSTANIQVPIVSSKKRLTIDENEDEGGSAKITSLSKKYCAPHSISENVEGTEDIITTKFETLREEVFGKRWPFELIVPSLRGLVASSIVNAPPLYSELDTSLFHISSLKTPLKASLRSRKNGKNVPRVSSFLDRDTPIIEFPKPHDANTTSDATGSQDPEETVKPATKGTNFDSVIVRQSDVDRLQPGVFLNDVLVNFYLLYIERVLMKKAERKRVKIFSSYFFTLLYEHGYDRVQKWLAQQSIFDYDFVVIPINLHLHWKVAILCNPANAPESAAIRAKKAKAAAKEAEQAANGDKKKSAAPSTLSSSTPQKSGSKSNGSDDQAKDTGTAAPSTPKTSNSDDPKQSCILILDSLGSSRDAKIAGCIRQMAMEEAKKREREIVDFDASNLTAYHPPVPQQPNYTDCGLFLLHYVEKFCLDMPNDLSKMAISSLMGRDWFSSSEVSGKRRTIVKCIDALLKDGYAAKD